MEIKVLSVFPQMCRSIADYGIIRRAIDAEALQFGCLDPRDFTRDPHRSVDDRPYGGGPGMLMKPEPLAACIDAAKKAVPGPVIYLTPQGEPLKQKLVEELSSCPGLILLAGRYEGIDERIIETRVDREISIGDYVLAGGELGAMVVVDAVSRLLPGVLGNDGSAGQDSFSMGMLDCPHYTRPESFEKHTVPAVLLSGDHEKIRRWRLLQALARTKDRRPDLFSAVNLDEIELDAKEKELLQSYQLEHKDD